ncbi:MAG: Na/Pi symporter [Proteobacteria bacterium]|nr:Na/Pi symporter [Pseudomonadota bacterium]
MNNIVIALAGLGLFLTGLSFLVEATKSFTGSSFNKFVSRLTSNSINRAFIGSLVGTLSQSTSAATFFIMGLLQANVVKFKDSLSLLAWSGMGTSILVFLASIDIQFVGYLLLSIIGLAYLFNVSKEKIMLLFVPLIFAIGLIFLGLGLIKFGTVSFGNFFWVTEFFEFASETILISVVLGLFFSLATQSSSSITMIVIALVYSSVIPIESAAFMVIGSNLGSGIALVLFHTHLEGQQKRVLFFQLINKCSGSFILFMLLIINAELVLSAPSENNAKNLAIQLAMVYLLLQLAGAIFCDVFKKSLSSFLTKWLPENERDLIAKPKYLYPEAISNSTIAKNLIIQEQSRLLAMMPDYLESLRENNKGSLTQSERHEGYMTLCKNIKNFSDDVITLNPQNEMADLLKIQSKNESIESLLITLQNFVSTANELDVKKLTLSYSIVESLHMILTLLQESQSSPEDNEILENLTSDKGSLMDKIRDQLMENKKLSNQEQKALFLLTRIFERLIWQIRKHSLIK